MDMRAVVIVANPNPESFSHAIAARVRQGLEASGHQVVVHDLYAEGFRAAMSAAEREAYHGDDPVLDPLVAEHIADLKAAHTLVFIYPTWWSSVPAVLKGWFERVMVPGVGFVFNDQQKVRPGLTNVKRLVGITTYGSPWRYIKTINDNGRRTIKRALRLSTGWGTRSTWLPLYGMDTLSAAKRQQFLAKVEQRVAAL
jgi:NAD(P)H dehydrogenase (quinone)